MNLREVEVYAAYCCVAEFVHRRRRSGIPIPDPVRSLLARLDASRLLGPEPPPPAEELIDVRAAAEILGRTTRQVRRLAASLDGVRVGDRPRWVFQRSVVEEYAAERDARAAG
ncbi:hypothetical protein [Nocardia mangyaensis]|uniref:hypothetical protein n=1 Tax=Nocardia mangyaensis TaxID=2213200 RepID=UPI002676A3B5|nr:hypothetical protein [Nocardia mangyaensis]MDO3647681.1 hypothetical protein [Nocardia mangyaensis]